MSPMDAVQPVVEPPGYPPLTLRVSQSSYSWMAHAAENGGLLPDQQRWLRKRREPRRYLRAK